MSRPKLIRITTVPISLKLLLTGQFTFFQQQGFDVLTVSANGPEVSYLHDHGIPHRAVPMTRTISPLQDLRCLFKLIHIMRSFRPDIVHTHTPKAGLLGMMAAWICRVPVRMHTVAGLPLMEARGVKKWVLKLTEMATYWCAQQVYPNSKGLFDYMTREFYMPPSKCRIIGKGSSNGIDTDHFYLSQEVIHKATSIRDELNLPSDAVVFCFVGRVVRDKGIGELVAAFQHVLHRNANAFLLLVGPLEQALDPLDAADLQFLQSHPNVRMPGYQSDVRPWMACAQAFVFPSYREGFPNVVMQASCLEVPCIVSDINGNNELIEAGRSGWVVPPKDAGQLAAAMIDLQQNYAEAKVRARYARDFVVKNFSRAFVWRELLREYQAQIAKQND